MFLRIRSKTSVGWWESTLGVRPLGAVPGPVSTSGGVGVALALRPIVRVQAKNTRIETTDKVQHGMMRSLPYTLSGDPIKIDIMGNYRMKFSRCW